MLMNIRNVLDLLPVVRFELYNKENCFLIKLNLLPKIISFIKNHYKYRYNILSCVSGGDYPNNLYRFQIVYELLSLKFNSRIRFKIITDEIIPVYSIESIFPGSTWWECEVWDMFGVFFSNQYNLTRLLTDYGFQGFPLRKDFPLTGFLEVRYNTFKKRVVYENLNLAQEYRTFDFISPWENFDKK